MRLIGLRIFRGDEPLAHVEIEVFPTRLCQFSLAHQGQQQQMKRQFATAGNVALVKLDQERADFMGCTSNGVTSRRRLSPMAGRMSDSK